jgi:hypothetical protein
MERLGTKISKACEPCRRRKVKCNGKQPCGLCQQHPAHCLYRAKARDRTSARQRASRINNQPSAATDTHSNNSETPLPTRDHPADPEVYRGVTATHTQQGPNAGECAQLFYGPSSNFALICLSSDLSSLARPRRSGQVILPDLVNPRRSCLILKLLYS